MQVAAGRKPEVIRTVKESFQTMADSFLPALSAGGVPIVAAFMVALAGVAIGTKAAAIASMSVFLLVLIPSFVAVIVVAQAKAIGMDVPTAPGALFMRGQFWKCVGASVLVAAAGAAVLFLAFLPATLAWASGSAAETLGLAFAVGFLVGIPASAYVGFRLNLLMPSLVAGQPFSVPSAWQLAGGNVLGIFLSTLLCTLPISLAQSVVDAVGKGAEGAVLLVAAGLLSMALAFVQCLLTGAVGGIYYRELSAR